MRSSHPQAITGNQPPATSIVTAPRRTARPADGSAQPLPRTPRRRAAGACWGRCSVGPFWAPLSGIARRRSAGRRRLLACLRPRALSGFPIVTEAVLEGVRALSLQRPDGRIVAWSEFGDEAGCRCCGFPERRDAGTRCELIGGRGRSGICGSSRPSVLASAPRLGCRGGASVSRLTISRRSWITSGSRPSTSWVAAVPHRTSWPLPPSTLTAFAL